MAVRQILSALLLLLTASMNNGAMMPRSLRQFAKMIRCTEPGVNPFSYNNYGCYCGLGGKGSPVDKLDGCCQDHDACYTEINKIPGCRPIVHHPYFLVYDFTCTAGQLECPATQNRCKKALCECDRTAALCFAQFEYKTGNKNLNRRRICGK